MDELMDSVVLGRFSAVCSLAVGEAVRGPEGLGSRRGDRKVKVESGSWRRLDRSAQAILKQAAYAAGFLCPLSHFPTEDEKLFNECCFQNNRSTASCAE